jgi:hypothetical protein
MAKLKSQCLQAAFTYGYTDHDPHSDDSEFECFVSADDLLALTTLRSLGRLHEETRIHLYRLDADYPWRIDWTSFLGNPHELELLLTTFPVHDSDIRQAFMCA